MEYNKIFEDEFTKKNGGERLKPVIIESNEMFKEYQKKKYKWIIVEDEDVFYQLQKLLEKDKNIKKNIVKSAFIMGGGALVAASPVGMIGAGTVGLIASLGTVLGSANCLKDVCKWMFQNYDISLDYENHTAILLSKQIDINNDTICDVPCKYILGNRNVDNLKIHSAKKERIKSVRNKEMQELIDSCRKSK